MGMLVNGTWFDDDPLPADGIGRFVRPDSIFRDWVTRDGSSGFKAEAGRYTLVSAPSCPWAHRTVLMRKLKISIAPSSPLSLRISTVRCAHGQEGAVTSV